MESVVQVKTRVIVGIAVGVVILGVIAFVFLTSNNCPVCGTTPKRSYVDGGKTIYVDYQEHKWTKD